MTDLAAELLEDGGAAASGSDFFRSPRFLTAEEETGDGRMCSLRILTPDGALVAPVLVRRIEGSDLSDAISPYGYPGMVPELVPPGDGTEVPEISGKMDPASIDFSSTGLVSAFIRHRLNFEPSLAGASPRNVCLISDPSIKRKSRPSDRRQIRRNLEAGYEVQIVPGPESSPAERSGFFTAYTETMERTEAAGRYFFPTGYFDTILGADETWLVIARAGDGGIAAASIATISDGLMHYYLSGTASQYLRDASMKNVLESMIEFAAERGLGLNLGGGITPGDPLEEFKRGFANREEQWFTSELVCDLAAYDSLSSGDAGGYFPAYRAP